jgi:hypothetical protein
VPAEQIAQDPEDKQLGFSAQQPRLEDFELMKTLGTGMLKHRGEAGPGLVTRHMVDDHVCRDVRARLVGPFGKREARGPS